MDLRVMSPSGSQDGRRVWAVFLTTLPRCGAAEEVAVYEAHDGALVGGGRRPRRAGARTEVVGLVSSVPALLLPSSCLGRRRPCFERSAIWRARRPAGSPRRSGITSPEEPARSVRCERTTPPSGTERSFRGRWSTSERSDLGRPFS